MKYWSLAVLGLRITVRWFLCGLHDQIYLFSTRVEQLSRGLVSHTCTHCGPIFLTYLATAKSTCGSCSHLLSASTLFVFLCGLLSIKIASAQRIPEAGHSCMAEKQKKNIFELFQVIWIVSNSTVKSSLRDSGVLIIKAIISFLKPSFLLPFNPYISIYILHAVI